LAVETAARRRRPKARGGKKHPRPVVQWEEEKMAAKYPLFLLNSLATHRLLSIFSSTAKQASGRNENPNLPSLLKIKEKKPPRKGARPDFHYLPEERRRARFLSVEENQCSMGL
jgi:hypothetical protein